MAYGLSTWWICRAMRDNGGGGGTHLAIDPTQSLRNVPAAGGGAASGGGAGLERKGWAGLGITLIEKAGLTGHFGGCLEQVLQ